MEIKVPELQTIDEIMSTRMDSCKRILLMSSISIGHEKHTTFVPWIKINNNTWVGVCRWNTKNNREISICERKSDHRIWFVKKEKHPILPITHPLRKELDRICFKQKYIQEKYGNK